MSRRTRRGRTTPRPTYGGPVPWLLSLPARLHLRWAVILAVMIVAMGLYGHTLVTAPPMPPGKAPVVEHREAPGAASAESR